MVPRALAAGEKLQAEHGIDCEVIDVRSLVPLDTQTILGSVAKTHRLFTVEENPRLWLGGGNRVDCRRGGVLRSRWSRDQDYHATSAAARGGHPRGHDPAHGRSHRQPCPPRNGKLAMASPYDNLLGGVATDLYIGGKWRPASDGARFDVVDPATESVI